MLPKARELQTQKKDLDIDEIPSLDDLIHGPSKHYPYQEVFENVKRVPVLVLHSSGSTGKADCKSQRSQRSDDAI